MDIFLDRLSSTPRQCTLYVNKNLTTDLAPQFFFYFYFSVSFGRLCKQFSTQLFFFFFIGLFHDFFSIFIFVCTHNLQLFRVWERWLEGFALTWWEVMRFLKHFSLCCLSSDIVVNQFPSLISSSLFSGGNQKLRCPNNHTTRREWENHNKNSHNYNNTIRVVGLAPSKSPKSERKWYPSVSQNCERGRKK